MKTKTSSTNSTEGHKRDKYKEYKYSGGVTRKLLEKYMPSKNLVVIRGVKEEIAENEAA